MRFEETTTEEHLESLNKFLNETGLQFQRRCALRGLSQIKRSRENPSIMLARPEDPAPLTSLSPLLDVRDIWFSYDRRSPVLQGVELSVEAGQIAMVLGRSGSGKTTLLKIIKGLLRPDRGFVQFQARENGTPSAARIAYIPQTLGLVRNTTALENTLTGALSRTPFARSIVKSFRRRDGRGGRADARPASVSARKFTSAYSTSAAASASASPSPALSCSIRS